MTSLPAPAARVLLVEDSPTQAEMSRSVLAAAGYEIELARDGAAGLAAAESGRFDVVVTDVVMPSMDGYEMCRRLKATPLGRGVPVILLTSLTEPMDVIRGLECGADNFITKPYEPAVLRSRVAALLESRRLRSETRLRAGVEVSFRGRRFTITSEREQILDLLMSTFEDAVRANEGLRAHERELAAANALLESQREEVLAASVAKSQFLANMSHELRTPLNAILGFSDLLLEQLAAGLSEQHARYLRNIGDAGRHLLELINDVLDLSKVEAGRIDIRKQTIDLVALLEPVIAAARTAADGMEIGFRVEAPEGVSVQVDPARVRQILYNLLSNAVKFTDARGSVTLRVSADGDVLVMDVTDTGIGIPAGRRSRVFGQFERLHEGRVGSAGTGLGLALTKRLVELHGGSIDFESEEGKGTTFRVRLFGAVAEIVRGARVLVVDDEQRDSDLICAAAAESGLRCEVVTTAEAALAAVRREHPRAIVLDLRLPDARGERVLETLKSDPATRCIPVIVVTVEDDEGRSRPLGADDHLTKPIDRQRLASWLRAIAAAERPT